MSIENYPARLTTGFYRVREKWDDPSTQVGASIGMKPGNKYQTSRL